MKIRLLILIIFGLISQVSHSQELDSILSIPDTDFEEIKSKYDVAEVGAFTYLDSAINLRKRYENDSALYCLSIANKFVENSSNDSLKAQIDYNIGRCYSNLHFELKAVQYFQKSITEYISVRDTAGIAKCYNLIGISYKYLMYFNDALQAFNQANLYYNYLDDSIGIGLVKLNIGNVFKSTGRGDLAIQEYFSAVQIFQDYKDQKNMANCYNNIGNVYKNQEQYDSALFYMHKTVALRKKVGGDFGLAYIYHNLANLHLHMNNTDSSLFYISQSFAIKSGLNDMAELASDYEIYGEIYMKKELWNLAIENFEKALKLLEPYPHESNQFNIYRSLGFCYYKIGDYRGASERFIDYLGLEDSLKFWNNPSKIEDEFIRYKIVADSVKTQQLLLEKDLQEAEYKNQTLEKEIQERNNFYIIIISILIFITLAILLISSRKRLQQTKEHEEVLTMQNEELKRTLISKEEKEILLKEIHHRVKNNLQIINSLIRLQSNYMNAKNFQEKLIETENRIRSMALIHEKLYKSNNLAKLNIRNYIEELCINILDSYESDTQIKLNLEIEELEYGIDTLIPIGLIINEALSNSIKHAFFERKDGEINITFKKVGKSTHLFISDNGLGADLSFEDLKEDSLGMELIDSLTDQLDGKLDLDTSNGFTYKFIFPLLD